MVVVFRKNLPQLGEYLLFIWDLNEPVMVIQTALFTHEFLQLLSRACLNSFSSMYRSYLLKLIYMWGYFVTVNNHRYGDIYTTVYIP